MLKHTYYVLDIIRMSLYTKTETTNDIRKKG